MVEKAKSNKTKTTSKKTAPKKSEAKIKTMDKIVKQAEEIKKEATELKVTESKVKEASKAPDEEKIEAPIMIDDTASYDMEINMEGENSIITKVEEAKPTCGSILKEARLAKNVTIKQVSSYLMIKSSYLEALENDDMESIPGKTYIYGYIRAYANYLSLNDNELINLYKETTQETTEENKEESVETQYQNIEKNGLYMKVLFLILGMAAFASVSLYGYKFYMEKKSESIKAVNEQILKDLMSEEDGLIDTLNEEAILKGEEISEELSLPADNSEVTEDKAVSEESPVQLEPTTTEDVQEETTTPISSVRRDIQMVATGSVWIKLKEAGKYEYSHAEKMDIGGGNDVYETLLRNGESTQLPTLEENKVYYLTIGNIENTKVILNGEEVELKEARQTAIFNIKLDTTKDIKEQLKRRI